jgi:hypothetical protein
MYQGWIVNPTNPAIEEFLNRNDRDGNLVLCCVSGNLRLLNGLDCDNSKSIMLVLERAIVEFVSIVSHDRLL